MEDIKTEKGKKINRKTLIVTRDIAQEKHMAYFRCPDGREEKLLWFSIDEKSMIRTVNPHKIHS